MPLGSKSTGRALHVQMNRPAGALSGAARQLQPCLVDIGENIAE